MSQKIVAAHRGRVEALRFTLAVLSVWTALLCYSVVELLLGRPEPLLCLVVTTPLVREPLKVALALLSVARLAEERGARIRALRGRRGHRGGRDA